MPHQTSPFVAAGRADRMTVRPTATPSDPLVGTVCRRALVDRDCPFTHDWHPSGGKAMAFGPLAGHVADGRGHLANTPKECCPDLPHVISGHDTRTQAQRDSA